MLPVLPFVHYLRSNPGFHPDLLSAAELNRTPEQPQKMAVSLFFDDPARWSAFAPGADLPPEAVAQEDALRDRFDFAPRRWVKWQYEERELMQVSQYLTVNPALDYPVTTLRLALKKSGASDVRFLEAAFGPAFTRPGTLWFVILKRARQDGWHARVRASCLTDRAVLPDLLQNLAAAGQLCPRHAACYDRLNADMQAGPQAYFSLDMNGSGAASLDFEQVAPASLPQEVVAQVSPSVPRYLKARFVGARECPVWSWYAPLSDFLTPDEQNLLANPWY